ncbi:MAG: hypothetical protein M4D80_13655 [Myxococcota bacterium]|nr:hypothetical protein [Myxococcota bacterium]
MHLNALYRAAEAGKQALKGCADEVASAAKWGGYSPRALAGKPIKYWHLRRARGHLDEAKRQLRIVRDNISLVASLGNPQQIDSSGGYAIADLLGGGLLDSIGELEIVRKVDDTLPTITTLISQVGELMMRMRKAGAVG